MQVKSKNKNVIESSESDGRDIKSNLEEELSCETWFPFPPVCLGVEVVGQEFFEVFETALDEWKHLTTCIFTEISASHV